MGIILTPEGADGDEEESEDDELLASGMPHLISPELRWGIADGSIANREPGRRGISKHKPPAFRRLPRAGPTKFKGCREATPGGIPSLDVKKRYALNELPQPQVDFTSGFSNLKPEPSMVST